MCVRPVHKALFHQWEAYIELAYSNFFNFLIGSLFLVKKLATWETNNLQSKLLISLEKLDELAIVFRGEGSLGCYIYD